MKKVLSVHASLKKIKKKGHALRYLQKQLSLLIALAGKKMPLKMEKKWHQKMMKLSLIYLTVNTPDSQVSKCRIGILALLTLDRM